MKNEKNLMDKIPSHFTLLGVIIILLSIIALYFAAKVLFF